MVENSNTIHIGMTRGNDFEIELYITQKIDIPNGLDEITV